MFIYLTKQPQVPTIIMASNEFHPGRSSTNSNSCVQMLMLFAYQILAMLFSIYTEKLNSDDECSDIINTWKKA